jgi:hypothetical protein
MKTLRSKYKQGDNRNKWKIQQCQCEKIYFNYHKDCKSCEGRDYCSSEKFRPYYIVVAKSMLVFADTYENAKEYASQGHGWLLVREGVDGIPIEVEVKNGRVTLLPVQDSEQLDLPDQHAETEKILSEVLV